ncbi:hypothetical protein HZA71_00765, partial [Candidatus Falkowbacteria bacterium]|nr:hypothetical protein [Candidatus Falkowbacteria bacterium]
MSNGRNAFLKRRMAMSNGNVFERLFKLWTMVCEMILDGQRDPGRVADVLQGIVDEPHQGLITLVRAIEILGPNNVITADAEARAWNREVVMSDAPVRYTEATLLQAAEENKTGQADWRLVFVGENSLRNMREIIGTDRKKQPCFHKDSTWWLGVSEDAWAAKQSQVGYYLVD